MQESLEDQRTFSNKNTKKAILLFINHFLAYFSRFKVCVKCLHIHYA